MRAVVLVGGRGTRLGPLTATTPKQLLPVVGVPMIERVLAQLARSGIDEVVLSLGYRPDAFVSAYPEGKAVGVRLHYAVEPEPLDTGGAIRFAATFAGITEETFVVVNGDVLTDLDVATLVAFHHDRQAVATIHLTPVDDPSRYGVVSMEAKGRVLAFIEKPAPGQAPTNLINGGTYVFEPSALEHIPPGRRVSVERGTFPQLVEKGALFAMADDAYWLDAGTPQTYLQAQFDLLGGARAGSDDLLGDARAVAPGVWVRGAAELSGSVQGPSFIDDGAVVERGATVTASVIGSKAVVEHGAVVEGSVLFPHARVAAGARVRRSVIGTAAVVSPGCAVDELSLIADGEVLTGVAP